MSERDLTNRAIAAYYRAADGGAVGDLKAEVVTSGGLLYVRLFDAMVTLAVYRVRTVGGVSVLKGLKRWPESLRGGGVR